MTSMSKTATDAASTVQIDTLSMKATQDHMAQIVLKCNLSFTQRASNAVHLIRKEKLLASMAIGENIIKFKEQFITRSNC